MIHGDDDMIDSVRHKLRVTVRTGLVVFAYGLLCVTALQASDAAVRKVSDRDVEKAGHSISSFEADVGHVETVLNRARDEITGLVAVTSRFPVERRLLDADLYFDSGQFELAAALYRDALDRFPAKNSAEYFRVALKLGESLYNSRNLTAARHWFMIAADPAAGSDYPKAVARLFEVLVDLNDRSDSDRWASRIESGSIRDTGAVYSYAKYLYHGGEEAKSYKLFSTITEPGIDYARARYFMAVMDAAAGRNDDAVTGFSAAAAVSGTDKLAKDIRGRALLAQSRVRFLQERYDDALLALQSIEQDSSSFADSLYDSAWIYVKSGDLNNAVFVLNMLLMQVDSGDLAMRAGALRGRILSRIGDIDGAEDAYRNISDVLGPVVKELDGVAASKSTISDYFDYVTGGAESIASRVPVSERTARWLESDQGMQSVWSMFRDMRRQKRDVRESLETAGRLLFALQSGGAIETFPILKDKYLFLKGAEGTLLTSAIALADVIESVVGRALSADAQIEYQAAVKSRRQAAEAFLAGPTSLSDYVIRDREVGTTVQAMERQLFMVEAALNIEFQQIRGIDEWVRDQRVRGDGSMTAERETRIRGEIEAIRTALSDLGKEADKLKSAVLKASSVRNTPGALRPFDIKRDLLKSALEFEASVLGKYAADADPAISGLMKDGSRVLARALAVSDSSITVVASLLGVVDTGAADLEKSVLAEKADLERMVAEVQKVEMDSRHFSETEGYRLFESVRQRISGVLLEADLGVVDMAWERQQRARTKLKALNEKRSEKMKNINVLEQAYQKEMQRDGANSGESAQ